MSNMGILQRLKGESLLEGSHILVQLEDLKKSLQYKTDDRFVAFDDYFLFLQRRIDEIQRIALQDGIPALQASQYENELLTALEEILESVQKWEIKTIAFQGRLVRAKSDIDDLGTAFESWYYLAALEVLEQANIKFPATNIKSLATAEFNRLMDRSNLSIDALVEAVKIELKRLESKRKMAREKFEMGRKQVDAAWATRLPESKGYGSGPPAFGVLSSGVIENDGYDDAEGPVAYVSQSGEVKGSSLQPMPEPQATIIELKAVNSETVCGVSQFETTDTAELADYAPGQAAEPESRFDDVVLSTHCAICFEPQFLSPSGVTCPNGHGGAASLAPSEVPANKIAEPAADGWAHSGTDNPSVGELARELQGWEQGDKHEKTVAQLESTYTRPAAPELTDTEFQEAKAAVAHAMYGPGEVAAEFNKIVADAAEELAKPVIEDPAAQNIAPAAWLVEASTEPTVKVGMAVSEVIEEAVPSAATVVKNAIAAAKRSDFDDFDDEPEPVPTQPAPPVEIKGTFRKEIVSGPVAVIEEVVEAPRADRVTVIQPTATTTEVETKPTQRKPFDFDDFDVEDPGNPVASAPVIEPKPEPVTAKPTPAPVTAAKPPAATPRKATPVFDFDDDELS